MSIDERLFGWLHRRFGALTRRESAVERACRVDTQAYLHRLRALAGAGAARDVEVRLVEGPGGLTEGCVLLPARFFVLEDADANLRLLMLRATLAGALLREVSSFEGDGAATLERALPIVTARLSEELPGWKTLRDGLPLELPSSALVGRLFPPTRGVGPSQQPDWRELPAAGRAERRARQRPPPTQKRRLAPQPLPENPFTHSFEKVHTAEERRGGNKRADGSDELSEQGAALDELDLDEVVLSAEPTRSVYQADLGFGSDSADGAAVDTGPRRYDEWDGAKGRYLLKYCSVSEEVPEANGESGRGLRRRLQLEARPSIARVRAELLRLDSALQWHTRQAEGPEIDVDAVVERHAGLCAGHDGSTRLYVSKRRRGRSVALLVLLDLSMSTDGWVEDRRIFDVQRDAVAIFSLAADELVQELTLSGFCSYSRNDCRFVIVKRHSEELQTGLSRLARLEPRGYTRVGPALRHATGMLAQSSARRRALVLVSDGKPSDTDAYEGRRGIADVRQAVREAKQRGVDVFALSADPRSRALLPQMFGARSFAALRDARSVAQATASIVSHLSKV